MMPFFTSSRERRLWFALVVVLVGIYATIGQVPAIAEVLRERSDLTDNIFFALFIAMVIVAVIFIRKRPSYTEIAVGIGIVIIYSTAWLRIETLAERSHLFEYGLVAALVHEALLERKSNGRRVPAPAILALVISILLGWLDEGIQSFLPNRVYDNMDVLFNSIAALMIIGARWLLALVRRWIQSRS